MIGFSYHTVRLQAARPGHVGWELVLATSRVRYDRTFTTECDKPTTAEPRTGLRAQVLHVFVLALCEQEGLKAPRSETVGAPCLANFRNHLSMASGAVFDFDGSCRGACGK